MPSKVRNLSIRSRIKVHLGLTGKSFEFRHYSYNLPLSVSVNYHKIELMEELKIHSWDELVSIFKTCRDINPFWVFRGQENYEWTLSPSIERIDLKEFESQMLIDFKRNAHLYINTSNITTTIEWLSYLQHYGAPTRLLDWSYSPYVSAFFAMVNKNIDSEDAAIWAINLDKLIQKASETSKNLNKFNYIQSESYRFSRELEEKEFIELFMSGKFGPFILPISPKSGQLRLNNQQGVFLCQTDFNKTFQKNLESSFKDSDMKKNIKKIIIPSSLKPDILEELNFMNINYSSIFPGLEGYIKSLSLKHSIFYDRYITPIKKSKTPTPNKL